jgi:hypothetical protein
MQFGECQGVAENKYQEFILWVELARITPDTTYANTSATLSNPSRINAEASGNTQGYPEVL